MNPTVEWLTVWMAASSPRLAEKTKALKHTTGFTIWRRNKSTNFRAGVGKRKQNSFAGSVKKEITKKKIVDSSVSWKKNFGRRRRKKDEKGKIETVTL